jgi:hypothetical protein
MFVSNLAADEAVSNKSPQKRAPASSAFLAEPVSAVPGASASSTNDEPARMTPKKKEEVDFAVPFSVEESKRGDLDAALAALHDHIAGIDVERISPADMRDKLRSALEQINTMRGMKKSHQISVGDKLNCDKY